MIKVYIASPYTLGDVAVNVKRQIDTAHLLIETGLFAPYWPLHAHFLHMVHPKDYRVWMNQGCSWLFICDALLRLDGESSGADEEVSVAIDHDIPVFYSIDKLIKHYNNIVF